ncbi:hypothetical protein DOTSEDRAFT_71746 [Dothistroma septosporum NZE10]|uniref:Uncharacterized protein n=1 Tax=Dothistroma septosporum (strain NZE10 / CBS 128990) TaxID=675120 RepID=N1PKM1_DOTSN|nr:hypothetical protein DOTSEDRAFT_71746 [Dothistroma septosporum NZE10]
MALGGIPDTTSEGSQCLHVSEALRPMRTMRAFSRILHGIESTTTSGRKLKVPCDSSSRSGRDMGGVTPGGVLDARRIQRTSLHWTGGPFMITLVYEWSLSAHSKRSLSRTTSLPIANISPVIERHTMKTSSIVLARLAGSQQAIAVVNKWTPEGYVDTPAVLSLVAWP